MQLEHICGNTYVLRGTNCFPLYLPDSRHAVLMDTGYASDLAPLLDALQKHALEPVGILSRHTHVDHCGCHAYLRERYGCKIAASLFEAGVASSETTFLDVSYPSFSPELRSGPPRPIFTTDRLIFPHERRICFCGAEFEILPLPGHTFGQIGFITPDNVAYLSDAILSPAFLKKIKLPSARSRSLDIESKQQLFHLNCNRYVLAHSGVYENIEEIIDENLKNGERLAALIHSMVPKRKSFESIARDAWAALGAQTANPLQIAAFKRSVLSYLQLLAERGALRYQYRSSILYLEPAGKPPAADVCPL